MSAEIRALEEIRVLYDERGWFRGDGPIETDLPLAELQHVLADMTNGRRKIIGDTHLFWLTFCKVFAEEDRKPGKFSVKKHPTRLLDATRVFYTSPKSKTKKQIEVGEYHPAHLTIEGDPVVIQKIQKVVEELRILLSNSLKFSLPLDVTVVPFDNRSYLKRTSPFLDCRDWEHKGIERDYFESYVIPMLPRLSCMLGLSMSPIKCENLEVQMTDRITHRYTCDLFTISPVQEFLEPRSY